MGYNLQVSKFFRFFKTNEIEGQVYKNKKDKQCVEKLN